MAAGEAVDAGAPVGADAAPPVAALLAADRLLAVLPRVPRPTRARGAATRAPVQTRRRAAARVRRRVRAARRDLAVRADADVGLGNGKILFETR